MKVILLLFLGLLPSFGSQLESANARELSQIFTQYKNPYNYDLQIKILPSNDKDAELLLCFHGMGSDSSIAEIMRSNPILPYHIMAFNFPDYGLRYTDYQKTSFGTFEELVPAFLILKNIIIKGNVDKIHLYGFSAGGGALINILSVLNTHRYDEKLNELGIGKIEKQKILRAIQNGSVILEVPLKSFDEIADNIGRPELRFLANRAKENGMVPIENLKNLKGLSLNIFLYFADPDLALGNRDDAKFIETLRDVNQKGKTVAIIGKNSSHTAYHGELWDAYKKFISGRLLQSPRN